MRIRPRSCARVTEAVTPRFYYDEGSSQGRFLMLSQDARQFIMNSIERGRLDTQVENAGFHLSDKNERAEVTVARH